MANKIIHSIRRKFLINIHKNYYTLYLREVKIIL